MASSSMCSCCIHKDVCVVCEKYNGDEDGYNALIADILDRLNSKKEV